MSGHVPSWTDPDPYDEYLDEADPDLYDEYLDEVGGREYIEEASAPDHLAERRTELEEGFNEWRQSRRPSAYDYGDPDDGYWEFAERDSELERNQHLCVWCNERPARYPVGGSNSGRRACGPDCQSRPGGATRSAWNPPPPPTEAPNARRPRTQSKAPF